LHSTNFVIIIIIIVITDRLWVKLFPLFAASRSGNFDGFKNDVTRTQHHTGMTHMLHRHSTTHT